MNPIMTVPEELDSLISQVAMADRSAFETLYTETVPALFGVACRLLDDPEEAEGCLQDLYAAIWADADLYRGHDLVPMARLATAVRTLAIAKKRARYTAPDLVETRDLFSMSEEDEANSHTTFSLEAGLASLQPARAILLRRACLDGEGYEDLARASEVDAETVRTSLQKGLHAAGQTMMPEAEVSVEAAEYVLGLMPEGEVDGFEARMESHADLAAQVSLWQSRLSDFVLNATPERQPPAQLARRLHASIFKESRESIWQLIWPYAFGGIVAALVLWLAVSANVLLPL